MKYMNDAGDIAELNNPADGQDFVYPVIDGEHKMMRYDDFIKEFCFLPKDIRFSDER